MHSPQPMPNAVLDALAAGGVVICSNARAARALRRVYGEFRSAQGERAWETPAIVDWTQWLHAQWMQLLLTGEEQRTLLTALQEEVLWNEIVRPTVEARSLISAADVARLAASAYSLLNRYEATHLLQRGEWDSPNLEPELFRKWALELERRCERNLWLCEARLPWAIAEAQSGGQLAAPPAVLWNGFDRLTAVDQGMRLVLDQSGCTQSDLNWNFAATETMVAAPSRVGEIETCARWARHHLEQHPGRTIGILLPDLEQARPQVDRIFRRILSASDPGIGQQLPLYEFTLGLPFASVPVIAAALSLLHWCVEPQEQATITWLMTTGFFSRAGDSAILAEADIRVRKHLSVPELAIEEALERLSTFAGPTGGNWAVANWVRNMHNALAQFEKAQGRTRPCAEWVSVSLSVLKTAGWPGGQEERGSDSVDFQVRERWQRALEEVSALSFNDRRYDFRAFLKLLASHLRSIIFSPESVGAPITLSGIPESAGRSFDALWILGATDKAFPASARMHPLLPAWLQIEKTMPGSSSELDWRLASSALERLRSSAREIIFSYAKEGTDGEQRPSSLLAHLDAEASPAWYSEDEADSAYPLEIFADEMMVAWPGGRSAGGQSVLKDQSACPFKAFAGRRLGAQEAPSFELGLSASERGSIAHNLLASLWSDERMRNRDNLRSAIFSGQLASMIQRHVSAEFEQYEAKASTDWERSYLRLEQERVCSLLDEWMRIENQRAPFEVEKVEENETIILDGLELNVRMDRIDKVNGGRLLIDYKTGQIKAREAWEGERPTDPQLPIYAISGKVGELQDVLFARVAKGEMKFFSAVHGSKPDIFKEHPVDAEAAARFDSLLDGWTSAIHALSHEFQQGIATVMPKDYPKTCQYCKFPALCRIAEAAPALAIDGDDEE